MAIQGFGLYLVCVRFFQWITEKLFIILLSGSGASGWIEIGLCTVVQQYLCGCTVCFFLHLCTMKNMTGTRLNYFHCHSTTDYGLGGLGIESRWRRDFPHLSRPALGPTQSPVQ
jgi:hypothetical protein